jgi:hypothetical protein
MKQTLCDLCGTDPDLLRGARRFFGLSTCHSPLLADLVAASRAGVKGSTQIPQRFSVYSESFLDNRGHRDAREKSYGGVL